MNISNFKTNSNAGCKPSRLIPDVKTIKHVLAASKKKALEKNSVIIVRYAYLKKHKLTLPTDIEFPNLVLTITPGNLKYACYTDVMNHIIKKQNYEIYVIN